MAKVCLDPGHGGSDPGALAASRQPEKETNLIVSLVARRLLTEAGHAVLLTRESDMRVDLAARCAMANNWGADVFVSLHADASSNPATRGHHAIRSIHAKPGEGGDLLANLLVDKLAEATGRSAFSRRVWSRPSETVPGRDYYAVIRDTKMPAVILERGFLTNAEDARLLFDEAFLQEQAQGIAKAVAAYFAAQGQTAGTPILASARATVEQAQAWARSRGATEEFTALAPLYWRLAPERGGADPAGAYCQAAKEQALGRFGGVLDSSFHNPCGMKTAQGGANSDPGAHQRFASWEEGVAAHLDHLALYAGASGYPRPDTPDPRHFPYLAGTARTFEALGGKWAPSPDYGRSIVRDYLEPLLATPVPKPEQPEPAEETVPLAEYRRVVDELELLREKLARIREIVA